MKKLLVLALLATLAGSTALASGASSHQAALQVRSGTLGRFIVDGQGRTLYLFEKDKRGKSACYGACAKVWAPETTTGKPSAGKGATASKIGTTKRRGGAVQATYGGHPLYRYDDDHKPGQTRGEGSKAFGAEWYVVAPSGSKIDKS
jgi:predicted lipoprotein with Yx(FWY)xxD motif